MIKESLSRNKDGVNNYSEIAEAEHEFATFAAEGSRIVPGMDGRQGSGSAILTGHTFA